MSTRLVETGPGVVKLSNPVGHHDDIVAAVGMVCVDLVEEPATAGSGFSIPAGRHPAPSLRGGLSGTLQGTTPSGRHNVGMTNGVPQSWLLRRQKARSPRGIPGGPILGVPGAHDDPRKRR